MTFLDALASLPVMVSHDTTLELAARALSEAHVGALIVTRDGRGIGLVTDREIALAALAGGAAPPRDVGSIVRRPLVSLVMRADQAPTLQEVAARMRAARVRRVVLVDPEGVPVGLVSMDDILLSLGRTAWDVAAAVSRELYEEREPTETPHSRFGKE